jgi:DMSO/TMAO reductase YedYZ molybdopterin-dependent catalytic subunit
MINGNLGAVRRMLRGALAGFLAAAVALGVAELVAGITGPLSSPVVAVGGVAIDLTPIPLKDFAIAHFGSNDKNVLVLGIMVQLAIFALVIGALAVRWLVAGLAGLAVFGALGVTAVVTRPSAGPADALPTLVGVAVAAIAMVFLVRAARTLPRCRPAVRAEAGRDLMAPDLVAPDLMAPDLMAPDLAPPMPATMRPGTADGSAGELRARPGRRRFLALSGGSALLAVAAGGAGELLLRRFNVAGLRAAVRLPAAAVKAPAVPAGTELAIAGITPFYTSDNSFYRVDTDLVVPQVSPEDWTLRITGMVDHPIELSFGDLLRLPLIEHDMTLVCVSNQVGGPYAGNARWLGASLPALLRKAGIKRGADQVLSMGTDGMTISTAVDTIMDGRQALIAVGMNGQALPTEHGFPARMLVPGLYGYVSATKWVTELEVTTFASQQAYWTKRGYARQALIHTESRIDVPKPLAQLAAGRLAVAGVAWAPHRGVSRVEVNVDGGPWHVAKLAAADGTDTWRQWSWAWDAPSGLHTLQVRATDGTGAVQTQSQAGVFPSGATGWDSVVVTVS